jgi:hypothetical protein
MESILRGSCGGNLQGDKQKVMRFVWTGDHMRPLSPSLADKEFVVDCMYLLEEVQPRSQNSHSHFFAALHDSWLNLPEEFSERYPTSEHLRKYALIKAGYCDSQTFVCASKAEAERLVAFIKPIDEFSVVLAKEYTVTRYTAKSQSYRAMGKDDFQKSKEAVLEIVSAMIGTTKKALTDNAASVA